MVNGKRQIGIRRFVIPVFKLVYFGEQVMEIRYVTSLDNRIIGTATFCKSRWKQYNEYGEIVSIYFLSEYMGKGYGYYLLNACIEELKKSGFHKIILWVLEENQRARKFYENNGFICTDNVLDDNIGGKDLKEIMYMLN